ncbi:hypothetical protein M8C13_08840 [Crossiella sp. SN42]|uniref:hypothetical protein n=1 Tax=Crossiella sp. SN42 TaxID=2944808 RepID=UPI00207C27B6|nr:hypothetical protein [Crossiella sp. SN42]MCO1575862.1 hypothetical protein [Crossiella sp. SN42]
MTSTKKFGVTSAEVAQVGAAYAAQVQEIAKQGLLVSSSQVNRESASEQFAAQGSRYEELVAVLVRSVEGFAEHAQAIGTAMQQTARQYSGTDSGAAHTFRER